MASNCICLTDRDGVLHPRRDCPVHGEKKYRFLAAGAAAVFVLGLFVATTFGQHTPATSQDFQWPPRPICSNRPSVRPTLNTATPVVPTITALPSPIESPRPTPTTSPTPITTC